MSEVKFSVFSHQPFIDLNLFQYGYEKCDPLHSYGPAKRNHFLFHYVISGKGVLRASNSDGVDQEYSIGENQGFLILPGQVTTYTADPLDPWEYAWVEFDGIIVNEVLMKAGLNQDNPIYYSKDSDLSEKIQKLLLGLSTSQEESPYKKIGQLYLLIDFITNSSSPSNYVKGEKMGDFYIKEISDYIERHYSEDITVEGMAEYLNLSRGYLNKLFKKYTGKSPKEFLTSYRMVKASHLLKTTQSNIKNIAESVGYTNQLHFSRAFKNYFGISPKMWRQINK